MKTLRGNQPFTSPRKGGPKKRVRIGRATTPPMDIKKLREAHYILCARRENEMVVAASSASIPKMRPATKEAAANTPSNSAKRKQEKKSERSQ